MSESMPMMPANSGTANATAQSAPAAASTNAAENTDSGGFTAVFAQYVETDTDSLSEQQQQQLADLMAQLLDQDLPADGNTLPDAEQAAMLQAMLLLPLADSNQPALSAKQVQALPQINDPVAASRPAALLNQDYFQALLQQNRDGLQTSTDARQAQFAAQLATGAMTADDGSQVMLSMTEQATASQGIHPTISSSLSAIGFGTVSQAAATQTQMAPLQLGQPAWESALAGNLKMMVGQNIQSAEIRLDPPELGSLDIKIKLANDVATVHITSPHAQVRDALETAVPKLREMFAESGLSLGDVNVQQEAFSQQQQAGSDETGAEHNFAVQSVDDGVEAPLTVARKNVSDNLLDIYA